MYKDVHIETPQYKEATFAHKVAEPGNQRFVADPYLCLKKSCLYCNM